MLATLYSLGTLATIVLAVYGIGRPLLRWLRVGDDGVLAATVWSIGLGFVVAGWLLSMAVLAGLPLSVLVGVITLAGSLWGLGEAACAYLVLRNPLKIEIAAIDDLAGRMQPKPPGRLLHTILRFGIAMTLLATLVMALAPPTSRAAMRNSLELPKIVVLGGSLSDSCASTPQFGGMIYAWALLLDGPVAATLLAWFFGLLLAASTALVARAVVGREWAWCAGAFALMAPGVAYQMSAPLDDLMMAAFATLALAAWWRGTVELLSPRWLILAGLFLGAALATKVVAVALLVAAAITWSVEAARRDEHRHEVAIGAARCLLIALIVASPWWTWVVARGRELATVDGGPSAIVQLGPWFLAIVPGLLVARRLRGLHLLVWVAVVYLLASGLIVPRSRAFAPLVPLLATIATWVCMELSRLPVMARRIAATSLAVTAASLVAANLLPARDCWRVACGLESRPAYLRSRVGAYAAAEVANRLMRGDSQVLSQDDCGLYFESRVVSNVDLLDGKSFDATGMLRSLRDQKFTHLLLCSSQGDQETTATDALLRQAVAVELAKPEPEAMLPLTEYRFTDFAGRRSHYQLLMFRR